MPAAVTHIVIPWTMDAHADVYRNYWKVTDTYSCLANEFKEGRDTLSELAWNFVMMMLAMETYYYTSGNESVIHCVREQMNTYYRYSSEEFFLGTGGGSNPAHDDAAWTAMGYCGRIGRLYGNQLDGRAGKGTACQWQ